MKRRELLTAGGASVLGVAALTSTVRAEESITWKMVTSWPKGAPGVGTSAQRLADHINAMSQGRLQVKVYGAGELVPPFEVSDAVQQGTAEIAHSTPYYGAGKNPVYHFFTTIPFGLDASEYEAWLLEGGGQALWDEVYAERGLKGFYVGSSGLQAGGWFNKEVNEVSDFKGLKMRIAGLGGQALRQLGVNAVLLPPGEIFQAMQTGAVDAAEWVGPWNDLAFGLHKVAKYYYLPAFHEPGPALEAVVNREAFEALPDDLRAIVQAAARATAIDSNAEFRYNNIIALERLLADGVQVRDFSDQIIKALHDALQPILAEVRASSPLAEQVYDSYMAFLQQAVQYSIRMESVMFQQRALVFG
jgi:TRAP-type mannitol/chloroaromatic compound transport system substrate-binding protein